MPSFLEDDSLKWKFMPYQRVSKASVIGSENDVFTAGGKTKVFALVGSEISDTYYCHGFVIFLQIQ